MLAETGLVALLTNPNVAALIGLSIILAKTLELVIRGIYNWWQNRFEEDKKTELDHQEMMTLIRRLQEMQTENALHVNELATVIDKFISENIKRDESFMRALAILLDRTGDRDVG